MKHSISDGGERVSDMQLYPRYQEAMDPVWWRGYSNGTAIICYMIAQTLTGGPAQTPPHDATNGELWQSTRHLLEETRKEIERLRALNAEALAALKTVMQHGRIDNSETRMNHVAAVITKMEGV